MTVDRSTWLLIASFCAAVVFGLENIDVVAWPAAALCALLLLREAI